jgi:hypothetical protein
MRVQHPKHGKPAKWVLMRTQKEELSVQEKKVSVEPHQEKFGGRSYQVLMIQCENLQHHLLKTAWIGTHQEISIVDLLQDFQVPLLPDHRFLTS